MWQRFILFRLVRLRCYRDHWALLIPAAPCSIAVRIAVMPVYDVGVSSRVVHSVHFGGCGPASVGLLVIASLGAFMHAIRTTLDIQMRPREYANACATDVILDPYE